MQSDMGKALVCSGDAESRLATCNARSDGSGHVFRTHGTKAVRSKLLVRRNIALILAVIMTISVLGAFPLRQAPTLPLKMGTSYVPHAAIVIDGNGQFTNASGVVWGSGTSSDPFIIEGYEIDSSSSNGIDIRNTDSYFVVRGVSINSTTNGYYGIYFNNVANGLVQNVSIPLSNNVGMKAEYSRNVNFSGNAIANPYWGIYGVYLTFCENFTVSENNLSAAWYCVWLEDCANGTVADNLAAHSAHMSVYATRSRDLDVTGNDLSSSGNAVRLEHSRRVSITGNNASGWIGSGMDIFECDNGTITDNDISGVLNGHGLYISSSRGITVERNVFSMNGVYLDGNSLEHFSTHSMTTDNTVNGKPLYFYRDQAGVNLDNIPVGQLIAVNCSNVVASNLVINDTFVAIELAYVHGAAVDNITADNDQYGIQLRQCENSNISDSHFSHCTVVAVDVESCSNTDIVSTECTAISNNALNLANSVGTRVLGNNISGCGANCLRMDACTNSTIVGNDISNNIGGYGIQVSWCANLELSFNSIWSCAHGLTVVWSTGVVIDRNEVSHNWWQNIGLYVVTTAVVSNNVASSSTEGYGIVVNSCSGVNLTGNNASDNSVCGIHVSGTVNALVADNAVLNDGDGLLLQNSGYITIRNNTFESDGIMIEGSVLSHFNMFLITTDNLVDGRPIYYFKNISGIEFDGMQVGQLIVANCTNVRATSLLLNDTDCGVEMAYADGVEIANVTVSTSDHGLAFHSCRNVSLSDIEVSSANEYGVFFTTCTNFSIMDAVLTRNTGNDIYGQSSSDTTISRVTVTESANTYHCVGLNSCTNCRVLNNTVVSFDYRGTLIYLVNCVDNIVSGNNVSMGSSGIMLYYCTNSLVADNLANQTRYSNIHIYYCTNTTVAHNDASGCGMYAAGIDLMCSTNANITNNSASTAADGGRGIRATYCTNINITGNSATALSLSGGDGIEVSWCTGFNVMDNNVSSCGVRGIYVEYSSVGFIIGNIITNNTYGIQLTSSTSLWVYHNNLINNSFQAIDDMGSENTWDDGYPGGGNYWSDYSGTDLFKGPGQDVPGSDGRGDTPMVIDSDTSDRYPLLYMWFSWSAPVTTHDYVNVWHNASFTVTLTATENPPGCQVVETYYSVNGGPTRAVSVDGHPLITTDSATNTLEFWSVDFDGREEVHNQLTSIKLDTTDPTGTITINDGATSTNTTMVTLNLTGFDATSGVAQMRFRNESANWTSWEPYSTTKSWNLSSSDGIRTVSVQFIDFAGNPSIVCSDSIKLQQHLPMDLRIEASENDIVLTWNPMTGASHYHIYISTSRNGFDLGVPSASTTATMWVHYNANLIGDVNYSKQYFYLVRVVDTGGAEDTNINILGKYTYVFDAAIGGRWNQFALALEPMTNYTVDSLADAIHYCDGIAWFNQTLQQWIFHAAAMPPGVFDTTVLLGTGYQVSVDNATPVSFTLVGR